MERPLLLLILTSILGLGVLGAISRPMLWSLKQDGTPRASSTSGVMYTGRRSGGVWISHSSRGRERAGSFVGRGPRGVK